MIEAVRPIYAPLREWYDIVSGGLEKAEDVVYNINVLNRASERILDFFSADEVERQLKLEKAAFDEREKLLEISKRRCSELEKRRDELVEKIKQTYQRRIEFAANEQFGHRRFSYAIEIEGVIYDVHNNLFRKEIELDKLDPIGRGNHYNVYISIYGGIDNFPLEMSGIRDDTTPLTRICVEKPKHFLWVVGRYAGEDVSDL